MSPWRAGISCLEQDSSWPELMSASPMYPGPDRVKQQSLKQQSWLNQ